MTQNIEYSLAEVLGKIDSKLDKLDQKFESKFDQLDQKFESRLDQLSKDVNGMKIDIATLKEGQNGVNKRIDDVNKRLDDWKPMITKTNDKTEKLTTNINNLSEKVGELKWWKQIGIILGTGVLTSIFWAIRNHTI